MATHKAIVSGPFGNARYHVTYAGVIVFKPRTRRDADDFAAAVNAGELSRISNGATRMVLADLGIAGF